MPVTVNQGDSRMPVSAVDKERDRRSGPETKGGRSRPRERKKNRIRRGLRRRRCWDDGIQRERERERGVESNRVKKPSRI